MDSRHCDVCLGFGGVVCEVCGRVDGCAKERYSAAIKYLLHDRRGRHFLLHELVEDHNPWEPAQVLGAHWAPRGGGAWGTDVVSI